MSDEGNDLLRDLISWSEHEGIETRLTTSYGSRGDLIKKDFEIFKSNVNIGKMKLLVFLVYLQNLMIRYHLEEGDEYFDYLYMIKVSIFILIIICDENTQSILCLVMNYY